MTDANVVHRNSAKPSARVEINIWYIYHIFFTKHFLLVFRYKNNEFSGEKIEKFGNELMN